MSFISYSDTVIQVKGEVQVSVKFNLQAPLITLTIVVIRDIPGSITPFLFGNDSFKTCLATLAYTGDVTNPQPEFIKNNPVHQIVNLFFASPSEIMTCMYCRVCTKTVWNSKYRIQITSRSASNANG